jgi:hypothetical protein
VPRSGGIMSPWVFHVSCRFISISTHLIEQVPVEDFTDYFQRGAKLHARSVQWLIHQ